MLMSLTISTEQESNEKRCLASFRTNQKAVTQGTDDGDNRRPDECFQETVHGKTLNKRSCKEKQSRINHEDKQSEGEHRNR